MKLAEGDRVIFQFGTLENIVWSDTGGESVITDWQHSCQVCLGRDILIHRWFPTKTQQWLPGRTAAVIKLTSYHWPAAELVMLQEASPGLHLWCQRQANSDSAQSIKSLSQTNNKCSYIKHEIKVIIFTWKKQKCWHLLFEKEATKTNAYEFLTHILSRF